MSLEALWGLLTVMISSKAAASNVSKPKCECDLPWEEGMCVREGSLV